MKIIFSNSIGFEIDSIYYCVGYPPFDFRDIICECTDLEQLEEFIVLNFTKKISDRVIDMINDVSSFIITTKNKKYIINGFTNIMFKRIADDKHQIGIMMLENTSKNPVQIKSTNI